MTTTIARWGNSQGIRLPKIILDAVNFTENEEIEITTDGDKLIITKANPTRTRKTIKELFADYKGNYKPEDIDWGEPVGNEIW